MPYQYRSKVVSLTMTGVHCGPWLSVSPCPLAPPSHLDEAGLNQLPAQDRGFLATLPPGMHLLALPQYPINQSLLYSYPNI